MNENRVSGVYPYPGAGNRRRRIIRTSPLSLITLLAITAAVVPVTSVRASTPSDFAFTIDHMSSIGPAELYRTVVSRYRHLVAYEDRVDLTMTISREDHEPQEVTSRLFCQLRADALKVRTPAGQARKSLGFKLPFQKTKRLRDLLGTYDLWLVPHMSFSRLDDPLREFRRGIDEGFCPRRLTTVTVDEREMMRLTLTARSEHGAKPRAEFNLDIDPQTSLVSRITGYQQMPDGSRLDLLLLIEPLHVESSSAEPPGGHAAETDSGSWPNSAEAPLVIDHCPDHSSPSSMAPAAGSPTMSSPTVSSPTIVRPAETKPATTDDTPEALPTTPPCSNSIN